jgi:HlyD family secretion protein
MTQPKMDAAAAPAEHQALEPLAGTRTAAAPRSAPPPAPASAPEPKPVAPASGPPQKQPQPNDVPPTSQEPKNQPDGKAQSQPGAARKPASRIKWILLAAALVLIGIVVWRVFFAGPHVPDNIVTVSGRIEGDDSAVAPNTGGRVLEVRVREGDHVQAGEVIAVLADDQVRAREDQARAALVQAEAQNRAALDQIAILEDQLRQEQIATVQARTDAAGRVRQAEADVAAAEADTAQQEAALQLDLFDQDAYTKLARSGAVSERQGKQAVATASQQTAAVAAAKRRTEAARGALGTAQANLANPGIHTAKVDAVRGQIAQQKATAASAAAQIAQNRAQLAEAQANRRDLTVTAPFAGTISTRTAEPGEVVTAGTPVATLIDLHKVYLRGFIPEGQIGVVRVGQVARIYLDSNPKQPLDAYVSRIDPEAAFTPENTYFRDDRVKQVVGVKLQLRTAAAAGYAKPGMPSDGEILTGGAWPSKRVAP